MAADDIKYKGDGTEFYEGIPARDLSRDEYDALDPEQRKTVRGSHLYDYAGSRDRAAESEPKRAAEKEDPKTSPRHEDEKKG